MRFAAVPVACGPSRGGWFSPAGQIVGRAPEIAGLCRRPVTGRVEVAVSARAIAARPHAAASRALPACFRPPSLPWRGRPSYQACQMKLRRFLLRYYPPGIILEYEQGGELRNKPVDLLTLTPESDLEVLVNQVVRQEALISENRKPQLRKLMCLPLPAPPAQPAAASPASPAIPASPASPALQPSSPASLCQTLPAPALQACRPCQPRQPCPPCQPCQLLCNPAGHASPATLPALPALPALQPCSPAALLGRLALLARYKP